MVSSKTILTASFLLSACGDLYAELPVDAEPQVQQETPAEAVAHALGAACEDAADCQSGHCEYGVCCDSVCPTCNSCLAIHTGLATGFCAPVNDYTDPHDSCGEGMTCWRGYVSGGVCLGNKEAGEVCEQHGECAGRYCWKGTCGIPGPNFNLADTNQRDCFTLNNETHDCADCESLGLCGQDAQYGWDTATDYSMRFTRTTDTEPVVSDTVTGLRWQGCTAAMSGASCDTTAGVDLLTWDEAKAYCENLSWGRFDDWHIPDHLELQSIADLARAAPCFDAVAFPNVPSGDGSAWWTSTYSIESFNTAWAMADDAEIRPQEKSQPAYVVCVRRAGRPAPISRFSRRSPVTDEPVVYDAFADRDVQGCEAGWTGTMCDVGEWEYRTWGEALAYCEELVWGGHADWYLPNVTELTTFVEHRGSVDSPYRLVFPYSPVDAAHSKLWASTTYHSNDTDAWRVNLADCYLTDSRCVAPLSKAWTAGVRCMRRP